MLSIVHLIGVLWIWKRIRQCQINEYIIDFSMLTAVGMDVQWKRLHGCLCRQDLTIFYKSMLKPDFLHKTYPITCCICQTWCMSLAIQWILLIKIFQNYFTNLLYLQIFNTNVAFGVCFLKRQSNSFHFGFVWLH